MSVDPTEWLIREVVDLLEVSSVGLYEFVWLLRGRYPNMSQAESHARAAEALQRLLARQEGLLIWQTWPAECAVMGPSVDAPGPGDWRDPRDGVPYLALARN